jgi:ABC-2 type transport system permease protein
MSGRQEAIIMRNVWLVARHEYRRIVSRRAFILLTLAIPLGLVLLVAIIYFVETSTESDLPLGYVDHAQFLAESLPGDSGIEHDALRAFANENAALAALEQGEIQAFYVFAEDYPRTLAADLYLLDKQLSLDKRGELAAFIRANLVRDLPLELQQRILDGSDVQVVDTVNGRVFNQNDINIIVPFIGALLFFIATMTASGYMLQIMAEEKENRTMEILLTSLTPEQLIAGKVAGLLAVILTQLGIYLLAVVLGLGIVTGLAGGPLGIRIPYSFLGLVALFFLPSFFLVAAAMAAVGSVVTNLQQGQQVAGLFNLFFMAPMFFLVFILQDPGGPLVLFLSLFPTTAFLTLAFRWALSSVPLWQIVVSWLLLMATAIFMMGSAMRIFRAGMLRYGQPLSLRGSLRAMIRRS